MEKVLDDIPSNAPLSPELSHADDRDRLLSPSFLGMLITQFLGTVNDNLFRWLVVWLGMDWVSKDQQSLTLSAGLAVFVLPFLLFAAPAGYLANRFSKRNVIVGCKVAEIGIMGLGIGGILLGNLWLMFVVLFLMGIHSALFSPSKYGSIPEIVHADRIPAANGLVGMTTILGILLGTVGASLLKEATMPPEGSTLLSGQYRWWISAAALLGIAVLGTLTSLLIRRLPKACPTARFPANPFSNTWADLRSLFQVRSLFLAALGSALFWSLGGLCQLNVALFGELHLHLNSIEVGILLSMLAVGVGAGNILAGIISRGKIELGLVPFGAAGIALSHLLLFGVSASSGGVWNFSYFLSAFSLVLLGISAGLYDVPLQSYLQYRSPVASRGSVLAATNFITFSGTILASGFFSLMSKVLGLSSSMIFLICGLAFIPLIVLMVVRFLAYDSTRLLAVVLMKLMYRVKVEGIENVPAGGALLTPNHVSWVDGLLVGLTAPRHPRMLVDAEIFSSPWIRWFGRLGRVIPISPGKKSIVHSLRVAREAINQGELVCVFPEGGITRTGEMREFQPGIMSIIKGTNAPVVPVFLDGLWGSVFSFEGGRFFWKIPKRIRPRITVRFGTPLEHPRDHDDVRQAVIRLGGKSKYFSESP